VVGESGSGKMTLGRMIVRAIEPTRGEITDSVVEAVHCDLLQAGADLVLMRPVGPHVLVAYVQVLLRRVDMVPQSVLNTFDLENFSLDSATRSVIVEGGAPQRLTRLEFRLLYVLVSNREQIVPSDTLIERVWGYENRGDSELLWGLISRVRRKVEPDPQNPRYIENVSALGYRFTLGGRFEGDDKRRSECD
jgi:DNA-binding response OmpR family regulator